MVDTDFQNEVRSQLMTTSVPGFDRILGGGLSESALYLVEGAADAGKTILCSQIAFEFVKNNYTVIYVSLISESPGKLLQNLRKMSFFDESKIANNLHFISGYKHLTEEGLNGLQKFLIDVFTEFKPKLLVIDGFSHVRESSLNDRELSSFIHDLNTFSGTAECLVMLLAPFSSQMRNVEHSLIDGLIEMKQGAVGMRSVREIEVHKLRGENHVQGRHLFRISDHGYIFFLVSKAFFHADYPHINAMNRGLLH